VSAGPSLKSVALAAGVSVSSVSNAYNKPEQLSEAVRTRILEVAREQGYAGPDAAARSLRSRRAGAIGMLFTEQLSYAFSDPYSVGLLAGLAEVAEQSRTGLLLIPVAPVDSTDPDAVETSVQAVRQAVIDGIVAYCVDPEHPAHEVIRSRGLPVVATNDVPGLTHYVLIDEIGSTRKVGQHLRKLGHRQVGVVLTSHSHGNELSVIEADESHLLDFEQKRLQGFREGLGSGAEIVAVTGGHNSIESGRAAAAELLDRVDRPTAIMATSDVMALGVLQAMDERRLVPGKDVSVTGFDDIPEAAAAGLTTVSQLIAERGRLMGRMLLDPDFAETRVVLPTKLIVRASTGPARR
jgi:DNA-binding LacI/PurR family transcriptional regulator